MIEEMNPPLILPMDSHLLPRSRARVDVAQTHRFPEFLQAPRQPLGTDVNTLASEPINGFRNVWSKWTTGKEREYGERLLATLSQRIEVSNEAGASK